MQAEPSSQIPHKLVTKLELVSLRVKYRLARANRAATDDILGGGNDCNLYLTTKRVFENFRGVIAPGCPSGCGPASKHCSEASCELLSFVVKQNFNIGCTS